MYPKVTERRSSAAKPRLGKMSPRCWMCDRVCTSTGWPQMPAALQSSHFGDATELTECLTCCRALSLPQGVPIAQIASRCNQTPSTRMRSHSYIAFLREYRLLLEIVAMEMGTMDNVAVVEQLLTCLDDSLDPQIGLRPEERSKLMSECTQLQQRLELLYRGEMMGAAHSTAETPKSKDLQSKTKTLFGMKQSTPHSIPLPDFMKTNTPLHSSHRRKTMNDHTDPLVDESGHRGGNPQPGPSPSPRKDSSTDQGVGFTAQSHLTEGEQQDDEFRYLSHEVDEEEGAGEEVLILRKLLEKERSEASQLMTTIDDQRREIELLKQKLQLKQQECTQLSQVSARMAQSVSKLDSVEQRDYLHERFAKRLQDSSRLFVELSSEKATLFSASTGLVLETLEQAAAKAKKLEAQVSALEKQLLQKQRSLEASRRAMLTAWEGDATPIKGEKDHPGSTTPPSHTQTASRRQAKTTVF